MTVVHHDRIGGRYKLRAEDGSERFEVLEGKGKVPCRILAEPPCEHPSASSSAPMVVTRPGMSALDAKLEAEAAEAEAAIAAAPVAWRSRAAQRTGVHVPTIYPDCPICLQPLEDDRGQMECCGKCVHKSCVLQWRRSNIKPRSGARGLKDE